MLKLADETRGQNAHVKIRDNHWFLLCFYQKTSIINKKSKEKDDEIIKLFHR